MKKPNITPGEWRKSYDNSDHRSGGEWFWIETDEDIIAKCEFRYGEGSDVPENNSNLIVTAGNLTNKNFRIEAIEEMYEILEESITLNEKLLYKEVAIDRPTVGERVLKHINRFKKALKNAKYDE